MKKFSITAQITIWYALFLVFITGCMLGFMSRAYDRQEMQSAKSHLAETVADQSEMVTYDGKDFVLDERLQFYKNETYTSIYTEDGYFLAGRRPSGISEFPEFRDKKLTRLRDNNGHEWYVYDSSFRLGDKSVWIRGIMNNSMHDDAGGYTTRLFMILLPALILVALLGGYAITKRVFRPIRNIINVADDIRADGDLTRRIEATDPRGEVAELTRSVNAMFDQIQDVLEREKQYSNEVAHEIRTPLAVIRAQSEYALENPENSEEALRKINRQAKDMTVMTNRILTLFKSDAGTLHMDKEVLDFSSLLEDIAEQQQPVAEEQGITITADIQKGIFICADESLLIRVILNLLSNAFKHVSKPGGLIYVGLQKADRQIRCVIADNGEGITEEQRDKIWQRFYQSEQSGRNEGSLGLGLAMVKSFTELMGGSAKLLPEPLNETFTGAAFVLEFPTEEEDHEK